MNFTSTRLPYRQTGAFSKIAMDYIDQAESLKPFFLHPPSLQGIQKAIDNRKKFPTNREVLVQQIRKQYADVQANDKVSKNIESLLSENTFTVTTAHQNNIFTGPLYFIYKIVHAVKLADLLNDTLSSHKFVPVFYIGSEDADLDELNHFHLGGEKLVWHTKQTGAVGRMKADKELVNLISLMDGQLSVLPHGKEIIALFKECYKEGISIKDATFRLVHALFAEYGLVIVLPDNPELKKLMIPLFRDELVNQHSAGLVETAAGQLENAGYKVQAHAREINLFYLEEGIRNRIEQVNGQYRVVDTKLTFSKEEILNELEMHPGRFSPNVILRGLYEETILPNIVFIGGGGETAYWLQLKNLFEHHLVPFPVLVLRNSFLIAEKKWQEMISKLNLTIDDFFFPEQELLNKLVLRDTSNKVKLNDSLAELEKLYASINHQASAIDSTLEKHVAALKTKSVFRLQELEKKMLRAEKRKFSDQQRQIQSIKAHLFPGNGLQERTENISYFFAKWGSGFINKIYQHSPGLEQEFVILSENN
jgi:bacillithiol biosynthesis cysteine-adding enzyme BshC